MTRTRICSSTVATTIASLLVCTALFQGCAATTDVATPLSAASPIDDEDYEKVLQLLSDKPGQVVKIASQHVLESATPQELVGLSCLAQGQIATAESRGKASESLRKIITALIATVPRAELDCLPVSNQWHVGFFTYSRWKTRRVHQPTSEPSKAGRALAQGIGSNPGVVAALAVGAVAAYAGTCIGTAGILCPIPGETVFVTLGTSAVLQDKKSADLVGVGVAQGSSKTSAWSALYLDPEALGLALAQALRSLASNYAASLVSEIPAPSQSFAEPLPQIGSRVPSEFFGMVRPSIAGDPATAKALILLVSNSRQGINVSPLFLLRGQDEAAFVRTTLSLRPQEILKALPEENSEARSNMFSYGCIIFASGRLVELRYDPSGSGAWKPPRYSRVTFVFKSETISGLRTERSDYHGSYVCSLERARWSTDLRAKVIAFLKRVTVGGINSPGTHQ